MIADQFISSSQPSGRFSTEIMEPEKLKQILEAALMVAASPVSFDRLHQLFNEDGKTVPSRDQLRTALEELENDYQNCGIELVQVASGYRFQARAEVAG